MEKRIGMGFATFALIALGLLTACRSTNIQQCSLDVGTSTIYGMARALTMDNNFPGPYTIDSIPNTNTIVFVGTRPNGTQEVVVGLWGGRMSDEKQIIETFDPKCNVVAFSKQALRNDIDAKDLKDLDIIAQSAVDNATAAAQRFPDLKQMTIILPHRTQQDVSIEERVEPRRLAVSDLVKQKIKDTFRNVTIWKSSTEVLEQIENKHPASDFDGRVDVWDASEINRLTNGTGESPFEDKSGMHFKPWWLMQYHNILEQFRASALRGNTP